MALGGGKQQMWRAVPIFSRKKKEFGIEWRIIPYTIIFGGEVDGYSFFYPYREGGFFMISFKRTKKRNFQHPGEKYMLYALAGVFVLMLTLVRLSSAPSDYIFMADSLLPTENKGAPQIYKSKSDTETCYWAAHGQDTVNILYADSHVAPTITGKVRELIFPEINFYFDKH